MALEHGLLRHLAVAATLFLVVPRVRLVVLLRALVALRAAVANLVDLLDAHHVAGNAGVLHLNPRVHGVDFAGRGRLLGVITEEPRNMVHHLAEPVLEVVAAAHHVAVDVGDLAGAADELDDPLVVELELALVPVGNQVRVTAIRLEAEGGALEHREHQALARAVEQLRVLVDRGQRDLRELLAVHVPRERGGDRSDDFRLLEPGFHVALYCYHCVTAHFRCFRVVCF